MTTGQILWGLNSFLFVICFFFVKAWFAALGKVIDKMETRLNLKLDAIVCVERNSDVKLDCARMTHHRHAPVRADGSGGEVIL